MHASVRSQTLESRLECGDPADPARLRRPRLVKFYKVERSPRRAKPNQSGTSLLGRHKYLQLY